VQRPRAAQAGRQHEQRARAQACVIRHRALAAGDALPCRWRASAVPRRARSAKCAKCASAVPVLMSMVWEWEWAWAVARVGAKGRSERGRARRPTSSFAARAGHIAPTVTQMARKSAVTKPIPARRVWRSTRCQRRVACTRKHKRRPTGECPNHKLSAHDCRLQTAHAAAHLRERL
jgi:hypothetical protein